jgi:hypothetical protein
MVLVEDGGVQMIIELSAAVDSSSGGVVVDGGDQWTLVTQPSWPINNASRLTLYCSTL